MVKTEYDKGSVRYNSSEDEASMLHIFNLGIQ